MKFLIQFFRKQMEKAMRAIEYREAHPKQITRREDTYPFVLLGLKHGEYFSVKQYTFKDWDKRKGTPFYKNVMREGIEL